MKLFVCLIPALLLFITASSPAQAPQPEHTIKQDNAFTGSLVRRNLMKPSVVPINFSYAQLSSEDRRKVHSWWEAIAEGDEPPYPVDGLKAIFAPITKAQEKLLVEGNLSLVAKVDANGDVVSVQPFESPNAQMTQFAGQILLLTKFKPAVCKGQKCVMEFPLNLFFSKSRL
jgi:hypothetical protein